MASKRDGPTGPSEFDGLDGPVEHFDRGEHELHVGTAPTRSRMGALARAED